MSKIVFFCIPAHGHTNPTLSVVRELTGKGHEVWYYSYNILREKIESTGAKFVSCDEYDTEQKLTPKDAARIGKDFAFSTEILVNTTLALDEMVCRDMERLKPDCIVADSMAVWGKAAAWKLGIPFVSSTTTFAFNRCSAKIIKQSAKEIFSMLVSMPKINKQVRRLQNNGYPVKSILDIMQNDNQTNTVVYTSPEFQPCSETFSEKYSFVGPSICQVTERIDKQRKTLVYISMGTVNNDMLSLYRNCIEALRETDYQVILSVGDMVDRSLFGELPENISVFSRVEQTAVLEQADVFLSHCGMNSASESLYFGVPLVMLPQTAEQRGVAARVEQLGAGLRLTAASPSAISSALEQVLSDSAYHKNAELISAGFRKCPGAKGAAEKILAACLQV